MILIHQFGKYCTVEDDPEDLWVDGNVYLKIYDYDGLGAKVDSPRTARELAKFLIEWAEKVEGEK